MTSFAGALGDTIGTVANRFNELNDPEKTGDMDAIK